MAETKTILKQAFPGVPPKRIARDVFRRERHRLPAGDYVLIAQPGASALDNPGLREQWLQLLERARSLKPTAPAGTMPASPDARERPATDS